MQRLLGDQLAANEQAEALHHLDGCPTCRRRLEELAAGTPEIHEAAQAARRPTPPSAKLNDLINELRREPPPTQRAGSSVMQEGPLHFLRPAGRAGVLGLLGSYEVLEEIARGAMGVVFKARDTTLGRVVAIKVLAPALAHDAAARTRFLREARSAAAINHEHVITIHAVEDAREAPFLVMQLVEGRSLCDRVAAGPLRVEEILRIAFQIASGLAAAHRLGLVHRDIKPSNILLESPADRVKITDFGLARTVDDTSLTLPGHIAGTPEYMAPEQARGEAVDQRADMFGLGCVLYEMATGISPFRAATPFASLRKVCEETPPLAHKVNPAVPEWLGAIVARLLAKDPAQRTRSAGELAEELAGWLARVPRPGSGTPDLPAPGTQPVSRAGHGRRRVLWVVAAVLVCGAVVWALNQGRPNRPDGTGGAKERFVVYDSGGKALRRFADLADAVLAAPPGSVVECRFNGELVMKPLTFGIKPIVLRAAPDFKPVLVAAPGGPLLSTRGSLDVEGLTFKAVTVSPGELMPQPAGPASASERGPPAPVLFIECSGAALMVANCRFLVTAPADEGLPMGPTAIHVRNTAASHIENCLFVGHARAIETFHGRDGPRTGVKVVVRNCTQFGSEFVSMITDIQMSAALELTRNTIAAEAALHAGQPSDRSPLSVSATRNVFDVDHVHRRDSFASEAALSRVLRWEDQRNLFSVRRVFAEGKPRVATVAEWKEELKTGNTSVEARLRVLGRLKERGGSLEQITPVDFQLTSEEQAAAQAPDGNAPADIGADLSMVGPGAAYAAWRQTPRYREWLDLIRQRGLNP